MEIINHRRKIFDVMESNAKGNNKFAIKVIITENVEGKRFHFLKKNVEEVRRMNQTYFFTFSKLLPWVTNIKATFSGKIYFENFGLECT